MKKYPKKSKAVYFFGTCLVDLFYPEAGMAGIKLLQREGLEVIFPQQQTCCGQPAFNSGFHDEARKVAAKQVVLFPKDIPIVIPSGSCGAMIRKHYAELFKNDDLKTEAESVAERIFELTEFLVHVLKIKLEDLGKPIKQATSFTHEYLSNRTSLELISDEVWLVKRKEHPLEFNLWMIEHTRSIPSWSKEAKGSSIRYNS